MASIINALSSGTGGIVTSGDASGILQLQTANTAAVTIDGSQNVGIGTTSPGTKLQVVNSGSTDTRIGVGNANAGFQMGIEATGTCLLANFVSQPIYFATNGTERMRITSVGDVLIGTTTRSNDEKFTIYQNAAAVGISVRSLGSALGNYETSDQSRINYWTFGRDNAVTGNFVFASNGTQRVSIDTSGNLLLSTTRSSPRGLVDIPTSGGTAGVPLSVSRGGDGGPMVNFYSMNSTTTIIGSIANASNTNTTYNTSSDHRLKENVTPMIGALAKVSALNPVNWKWKSTGTDGQGFIAHELAEVIPDCVTGGKDAVDADGNPVYQGVDTSYLVATLTKAIQELNAKVESLEARIRT
jgi:hypothetical protein